MVGLVAPTERSSRIATPPATGPPTPDPPVAVADLVTRLRAAGCVFAEEEADLLLEAARTPSDLAAMVARRVEGTPLEHVLGWVAFGGRRIVVEPGVFVPRRRTEYLVRQAAPLVAAASVVVDLCCGSGAVGAVLCTDADGVARAGLELHSADVDGAAVRCARRNLAAAGGHVYQGDLYAPLPQALRGRVDVLVANPPYVPTGAIGLMPPEARLHEARVALDGGADGLDVLRRVVAEAPSWLAPGGHLLTELGIHQVRAAVEAVSRSGLVPTVARDDDLEATVLVARRTEHLPRATGRSA